MYVDWDPRNPQTPRVNLIKCKENIRYVIFSIVCRAAVLLERHYHGLVMFTLPVQFIRYSSEVILVKILWYNNKVVIHLVDYCGGWSC